MVRRDPEMDSTVHFLQLKPNKLSGMTSGPSSVIFVGNPGREKSMLLSIQQIVDLMSKAIFKEKVDHSNPGVMNPEVDRTTSILQKKWNCRKLFGKSFTHNSPHMHEASRMRVAKEITEAFKQDGQYHVFFVVTPDPQLQELASPQELAMMRLVLESSPITRYSIIINQVEPEMFKELKSGEGILKSMTDQLNEGLKTSTDQFFILTRDDAANSVHSAMWRTIPQGLVDFIRSGPGMQVPCEATNDIEPKKLDGVQTPVVEGWSAAIIEWVLHDANEPLQKPQSPFMQLGRLASLFCRQRKMYLVPKSCSSGLKMLFSGESTINPSFAPWA